MVRRRAIAGAACVHLAAMRAVSNHGSKFGLAAILRDALASLGLLRLYVPSLGEATRPRCYREGYPDRPGRASNKEGESWAIIAKLSWHLIPRNCVMQWRLRMVAGAARCGIWARSRLAMRRQRSWCASSPPSISGLSFGTRRGRPGVGVRVHT